MIHIISCKIKQHSFHTECPVVKSVQKRKWQYTLRRQFHRGPSYIGLIERKQLISMEHSSREKSKCTPHTFKFVLVYKADCIHTWNTPRFYWINWCPLTHSSHHVCYVLFTLKTGEMNLEVTTKIILVLLPNNFTA